jgi:nicotinamidase-related amidase/alkylated DNA repair dioxygenase AlkB
MASKMTALMDLVSQNQPTFKTHQGLLVIGMQNDFIQPDGRLPVSTHNGYLDRIQALIPKFRELNGNVIWVQTLFESNRIACDATTGEGDALVVGGLIDGDESGTEVGDEDVSKDVPPEKAKSKHKQRALDLLKRVSARKKTIPREVAQATAEQDDELFLLKSEKRIPACVPDTHGAQFADIIAMQFELPADMVIKTTSYSAFQGTSLLMTLRAKLVTELYICGCISNVSVLATVIDGARHGIKINVIEDCLGYRKQTRHETALKRMDEFFDAYLVNSTEILARERPSSEMEKKPSSPNGSRKGARGSEKSLEALAGRLTLNDGDARPLSRPQSIRSPTKILSGGQRTLSLVSVAEGRKALSSPPATQKVHEPTDAEFADNLVRGATVPGAEEKGEKEEVKMVTKKIRMRSKVRKKKKKPEDEPSKDDTEAAVENGEPSAPMSHGTAEVDQPVTVTVVGNEIVKAPLPSQQPPTESRRTIEPQVVKAPPPIESRRSSMLSKAESVLNLREKKSKSQPLKSVASQPILSGKTDTKEKDKDRDSWSDRMRLSLSRAPKSDSTSEVKKRLSIVSMRGPQTPSKSASRPESIAPTVVDVPVTPLNVTGPSLRQEPLETYALTTIESDTAAPAPESPPTTTIDMLKPPKLQSLANLPVLGPADTIAEGDADIIHDFFPPDLMHPTDTSTPLCNLIFTQIYNEVRWQKMRHQQSEVPRLVCAQGEFGDDGSMPVYRHPSDQTLPLLHFSPKVQLIRRRAEELVGHPLNHVLIQMYRSGIDHISEHSDKTLDIVPGSSIVNVSFGAQRTLRLRTKKPSKYSDQDEKEPESQRTTQRIHLPHNSLFTLGLATNAKWLHAIQPDKRLAAERSPAEMAYNGVRISLTFRHIGTFIDARESVIWGQGASAKHARDAADVVNSPSEGEAMIRAFSLENHSASFDWGKTYGAGFDVLHLHDAPADAPILFMAGNLQTAQVQLALWEAKVAHTLVDAPLLDAGFAKERQVAYRDTDASHTEVSGALAILLYLDRFAPLSSSHAVAASAISTLIALDASDSATLLAALEEKLENDGGPFIAGRAFSAADCYFWPIVDDLARNWDGWSGEMYGRVGQWWSGTARRKGCVKKLVDGRVELEKEAMVGLETDVISAG